MASEYCKGCNAPTVCLSSDGSTFTILPGSDHVMFLSNGIYHLNPECHPNLKSYNQNIRICIETIPSLSITEHSKANKKKDSISKQCCICFESENICLMPCLHTICCDCYVKHKQSDNKCPVCRQEDYGVGGLEPAKKKSKNIRLTSQPVKHLEPQLMRTPSGPASLRQLSQGSQVEIDSDDEFEELSPYQRLLEEGKGVFKMRDLEGKMHKKIKALTPVKIDSTLDIASLDISKGFNVTDKLLVDVTTQKKGDSYNDLIVYIVEGSNIEVVDYYHNNSSNFSLNHSGDYEEEIDFDEVGNFNCLKHCCLFKLEEYKQVKIFFLNEVIANSNPPKIISNHNSDIDMKQAFSEKYNQFIEKFGDDKPDFVMIFAQVTYIADKTLVSMSPDISPCVSTIFNGKVYTAPWSDSTNMTIHCCVIGKN